MTEQQTRDTVTVGEIRKIMSERLESQIDTLSDLIKKGYQNRHQSEKYLQETIGETLTQMDNLNSFAGLPALRKILNA